MKKILVLSLLAISVMFSGTAQAAGDTATFSATSDKSTYQVGDDIKVSLSVDAGTYSTSLSVIDFKVKISGDGVVEPTSNTPLTLGNIYTSSVTQSYANGIFSAVVFVAPDNKPAQRSGVIGTLNLKATKVGKAVISYDDIQATEENNQLGYVTTTASSLTINVDAGVAAQGTQTAVTDTSSSTGTVATARTATPQPGRATTGPAEVIAVALGGGLLLFLALKLFKKLSTNSGKI